MVESEDSSSVLWAVRPLLRTLTVFGMAVPLSGETVSPAGRRSARVWTVVVTVVTYLWVVRYCLYVAVVDRSTHPRQWICHTILVSWLSLAVCVHLLVYSSTWCPHRLGLFFTSLTQYDHHHPAAQHVARGDRITSRRLTVAAWLITFLNDALLLFNTVGPVQVSRQLFRGMLYPFHDPMFVVFYLPMVSAVSFWSCAIVFIIANFCLLLERRFVAFDDDVRSSCAAGRLAADIRGLRGRFCELARCVERLDVTVSFLLAVLALVCIPVACFIAYQLVVLIKTGEAVTSVMETVSFTTWFLCNVATIGGQLWAAGRVHHAAHRVKNTLYDVHPVEQLTADGGTFCTAGQWTADTRVQLDLLLHQLADGSVGLTLGGVRLVTRDTLWSLLGIYLTYVALVVQLV